MILFQTKRLHVALLIIASLACSELSGAHILGGDVSVTHVEDSLFRVRMQLFRDCDPNTVSADLDPFLTMFIYEQGTNTLVDQFDMELGTVTFPELGDECFTPDICLEIGEYITDIVLDDNPNGLYFVWERCCRSALISNLQTPGDIGMVFTAEIPDPALQNNSPVFDPYPADGYFCVSSTNQFTFLASDADGDSLVYSLDNPIYGDFASGLNPAPIGGSPQPFNLADYQAPYSFADPVGGTPVMSIDSETGLITASPDNIGAFVFAVLVEEYRDGVKIGEVRREITLISTVCQFDVPPVYVGFEPVDTVYFTAFEANSLDVIITDNVTDTIEQLFGGEIFEGIYDPNANLDTVEIAAGLYHTLLTWDSLGCDMVREEPYTAFFYAESVNVCNDSVSYDTLLLNIIVQLPEDVPTLIESPLQDDYIFFVIPDTVQCLDFLATDGNYQDTLRFVPDYSSEFFSIVAEDSLAPATSTQSVFSELCWDPICDMVRDEPYQLVATVYTDRCEVTDTLQLNLDIYVTTVSDGDLDLVPNVITPNDDEINDDWTIDHIPDECRTEERIYIYNRWGQEVYTASSLLNDWKAEHEGREVTEGTYYYLIDYLFLDKPFSFSGNISVLK